MSAGRGPAARARSSATSRTTGWSTSRSTRPRTGSSTTSAPSPEVMANGHRGGRRTWSTTGDRPDPPRGAHLAADDPRRPPPPGARCPRRPADRTWPTTCSTTPRRWRGPRRSRPACSRTRRSATRSIVAVGVVPHRAARGARGRGRPAARRAADRELTPWGAAAVDDELRRSRRAHQRRRRLRRRHLRRRDRRGHLATVDRWDGKEASERIELHVGRDLQFIRINGTLVGGLVGLVIHAVTLLV